MPRSEREVVVSAWIGVLTLWLLVIVRPVGRDDPRANELAGLSVGDESMQSLTRVPEPESDPGPDTKDLGWVDAVAIQAVSGITVEDEHMIA